MPSPSAVIKRYLAECVILVDTREQRPWTFSGHETERVKLEVGDYSIRDADGRSWAPGNDNAIMVERKSIHDLVGSLGHGRGRFKRMWERASDLGVQRTHLIIEASFADIVKGNYRSKMNPKSVMQSIVSWQQVYHFHFWTADNPQWAGRLAESILEKHVTGILKREGM
jgi:ERCC4-type nuclease